MGRKKRSSKTSTTSKFPTVFESFKAGDQVIYTRISDGIPSLGRIWYFYTTIDRPCVLMIDLLLGNFRLGFVDEINPKLSKKEKKGLRAKAASRGFRL